MLREEFCSGIEYNDDYWKQLKENIITAKVIIENRLSCSVYW